MLDSITLPPSDDSTRASVIWMHGLGADGNDFVPIVQALQLPEDRAPRFVFPHAPVRPVTINMGMAMRAWFDIKGLDRSAGEDAEGIAASAEGIEALIADEIAAGVSPRNILLAGFSQGGAMALHVGLRHAEPLLGIMALSTYLPLYDRLPAEASAANREVPIFQCHGRDDPVLPLQLGTFSRDYLQEQGYSIDWREYAMQHEVCMPQIADIREWLLKVLP